MAPRRQIRRVHQRHRVRLHTLSPHQTPHQMLIDGTQPVDAQAPPKLMEHPGGGQDVSQPGEAPPRRLFRQLGHDQIERMRGGQHRQQMRTPQLSRTQSVSPPASGMARTNLSDKVIRSIGTQQFEQAVGAHRRQR
jgi:hypothetical protein